MNIPVTKLWARSLAGGVMACLLVLMSLAPALADENQAVTITTEAFVLKEITNTQGQQELQRIPAEKVLPGDAVIFSNRVTNNSDGSAESIIVGNPIPENMIYVDGSASGINAALTFSVDGGQKFDIPGKLMVLQADGTPRKASSADYTHIRWQLLTPLPSQGTQQVEFQAKVK